MTHQLGEAALPELRLVRVACPANAAGSNAHHRNLDAAFPKRHLTGRRQRANHAQPCVSVVGCGRAGNRRPDANL